MKFNKGQLVYNAHTGDRLYEVLGYNAGGGIILLPVGVEDKYGNRIVLGIDRWIYAKKNKEVGGNEMEYEVSVKVLEERASLVFVKITDLIYEVKKDRKEDFAGVAYVDSIDVLNSLNSSLKVVILNGKGNLSHKNF